MLDTEIKKREAAERRIVEYQKQGVDAVKEYASKVEEAFALYKEFTVNQHATHRYAMAKLKVRGLDKYLEK